MDSACPYLKEGTDSCQLTDPSVFFKRNIDKVSMFPWPEGETVFLFIYLERCKYHFITRTV